MLRNFEYRIESTTPQKTRWCCRTKERLRCRSRLLSEGQTIHVTNFEHNHLPTFDGVFEKLHSQFVTLKFYPPKEPPVRSFKPEFINF